MFAVPPPWANWAGLSLRSGLEQLDGAIINKFECTDASDVDNCGSPHECESEAEAAVAGLFPSTSASCT
mgnify:CR=1 FL=1